MADAPATTLLVLAGDGDAAAAAFVERYRSDGARLLSPADLSRPGWRYRVGDAAGSVAVAEGRPLPAAGLRGVITRLPAISGEHLPHVADPDRGYVAAEMTAFLIAWLSALPCPVLNRPVAPSLSGPNWRWAQWVRLASALGVPVAPLRTAVPARPEPVEGLAQPAPPTPRRFSVIGTTILGPNEPRLAACARRLADAAGVTLLDLLFDGEGDAARLVGIDPWPDLSEPAIGAALMAHWP